MGHPREGIHRLLRGGGRLHDPGEVRDGGRRGAMAPLCVWHHREEPRTAGAALRVLLALRNVMLLQRQEQIVMPFHLRVGQGSRNDGVCPCPAGCRRALPPQDWPHTLHRVVHVWKRLRPVQVSTPATTSCTSYQFI